MDTRPRQRMAESEVSQALGKSCASGSVIITQLSPHSPLASTYCAVAGLPVAGGFATMVASISFLSWSSPGSKIRFTGNGGGTALQRRCLRDWWVDQPWLDQAYGTSAEKRQAMSITSMGESHGSLSIESILRLLRGEPRESGEARAGFSEGSAGIGDVDGQFRHRLARVLARGRA